MRSNLVYVNTRLQGRSVFAFPTNRPPQKMFSELFGIAERSTGLIQVPKNISGSIAAEEPPQGT